jgi:hypothetical protein
MPARQHITRFSLWAAQRVRIGLGRRTAALQTAAAVFGALAVLPAAVVADTAPPTQPVPVGSASTGAGAGKATFKEFIDRPGPRISAATVARGKLHVTLTFHKSGTFLAYIVSHPPADPFSGNGPVTYTTVSLHHHAAGPGTVSLTLGRLTNGRDGLIIVPTIDPKTTAKAKQASWVYLTVARQRVVQVKLHQP